MGSAVTARWTEFSFSELFHIDFFIPILFANNVMNECAWIAIILQITFTLSGVLFTFSVPRLIHLLFSHSIQMQIMIWKRVLSFHQWFSNQLGSRCILHHVICFQLFGIAWFNSNHITCTLCYHFRSGGKAILLFIENEPRVINNFIIYVPLFFRSNYLVLSLDFGTNHVWRKSHIIQFSVQL